MHIRCRKDVALLHARLADAQLHRTNFGMFMSMGVDRKITRNIMSRKVLVSRVRNFLLRQLVEEVQVTHMSVYLLLLLLLLLLLGDDRWYIDSFW